MCDSMAKNMTLSIPDSVYALMKAHPEINWSNIAKRGIEAFAIVLSKAENAEGEIKKSYGGDVQARMNYSINENSNQGRNPMEEGMIGMYYNSGINFSVNVQPTKQGRVPQSKKILEDLTKK
jgi:hypothetical protein